MNTGKILSIHDKPEFVDRYTIVLDEQWKHDDRKLLSMLAINECPFSPNLGFFQHVSGVRGRHLGKKIRFEDLPFDTQKAIVLEF